MGNFYAKFNDLLNKESKDEAVLFILELLKDKKVTLTELYDQFFRPSLNDFVC